MRARGTAFTCTSSWTLGVTIIERETFLVGVEPHIAELLHGLGLKPKEAQVVLSRRSRRHDEARLFQ